MKNKNEGTCGHGPGGKLSKTPGGTIGMSAHKRTNDMLNLREFIRQEIKNITEHHGDEDFPEVEKPVSDLLDNLEDKDKSLYKRLEKFIQKSIQQEIARLKEAEAYNVKNAKGGTEKMSFTDLKASQDFVKDNTNIRSATKI